MYPSPHSSCNFKEKEKNSMSLHSLYSLYKTLKEIWELWDLRSFLLLSFTFQCILILTASMRKRTSKRSVLGFICLAYLLADWASYYAIGRIPPSSSSKYSALDAFWAPFLLLHLGGPNTISGFSMEDNELWKRSVLQFIVQAGMTSLIIYQALPHNPLLVPTWLMFVAASTRYIERVLALYYASMDKFRRTVAKNHGKNWESLPKEKPSVSFTEVEMVNHSYILFQGYKRVFGSLPIKFNENLKRTKIYLLEVLSPDEAFMQMEIQMNLAYNIFYTKMWLIIEQKIGKILHPISLCCEAAALILWALTDTRKLQPVDVHLTHILVMGAVFVDALSLFKLVFSDLMIPRLTNRKFLGNSFIFKYVYNKVLSIRDQKFAGRVLLFSRWSKTMPQLNLMTYICKDRHKRSKCNFIIKLIEKFIGPRKHGKHVILSKDVKKCVLKYIKHMSDFATSQGKAEKLCLEVGFYMGEVYRWKELKAILTCAGLVDAMLVCHLATELLYKDDQSYKNDVTTQLAEYLMCLLVDEPSMVGLEGVGFKTIMFEDTCKYIENIYYDGMPLQYPNNVKEALEDLKSSKGETTMRRSMLKYAHCIKDSLKRLEDKENAKDILQSIWVELLCHMAIKCSAWAHLEQLGRGGELLTVVWLLMTYLGITTNYEPQADDLNAHHHSVNMSTASTQTG